MGWSDVIGGSGGVMSNVLDTGACGRKCNIHSQCKAYNYSPTQKECMLITKQSPTSPSAWKDFKFCSKKYLEQPASPASDSAASSGCKGVKGNDCIFPFKYRGATFNNCKTYINWLPGKPGKYGWCATEVGNDNKMEKKDDCVKECNKLMRK